MDRLTVMLGVPRWKVKRWAAELNLTRKTNAKPWTEQEDHYIMTHIHKMSVGDMAKFLGRTKISVQVRIKREIRVCKSQKGYTMRGLEEALGADHHKIERWIKDGWLKASRRHTERPTGDMWYFAQADVKKFIRTYPNEIDQRRVNWIWLVDTLAGIIGQE